MDSFSGVVLVARHGRVVFHAERGLANKSFAVANRLDTKFYIASLTKMFTGVAVAQLAQAGRLRFSDRVTAYVPGLQVGDTAVTIHHLLTHTSGLGSIWTDAFQRSNHAMYRTTADYLPLALNAERRFAPGTSYHYSNAGFVLLGAVIERVTGTSYREYVREHVFRAAGMMSSMEDDVEVPIAGRAVPYTPANWTMPAHKGWTSAELIGLANMFSAGGAVSTAPDLLNFATALQQHRLLNAAYADTVTRGVATVNESTTYAYGFFNRTVRGHRIICHSGGAEGINANIDMVPDLDLVVVILSNYDPPATAALVSVARQALLR